MRQVLAFVLVAFATGVAQSALVAQYDGPAVFDGTAASDILLTDVNIGDEGTVQFEFKTDSTTNNGHMWTYSDDLTLGAHEYRIFVVGDMLKAFLYTGGAYQLKIEQPFTDTSGLHSLSFSWKNGSDSLFTLDGVTTSYPTGPLVDFVAGFGHTLGYLPTAGLRYTGLLQNVKVYDAYNVVPEPSTFVLCGVVVSAAFVFDFIGRRRRKCHL